MDALDMPAGALDRAAPLYDLISGDAEAGERQGRLTDAVGAARALEASCCWRSCYPEQG